MASLPTPKITPSGTSRPSPNVTLSEHRLQEATIVPVPRPPAVSSPDW